MTGFERLKEQVKDQKDKALLQTVDYLLSREDMEQRYLNDEKSIEEMRSFIKNKANMCMNNGWNYIKDEVVYAWSVMYFSLPNSFLKIEKNKNIKEISKENSTSTSKSSKNNIVSLEEAKKNIEKKKEVTQLSLFGGGIVENR